MIAEPSESEFLHYRVFLFALFGFLFYFIVDRYRLPGHARAELATSVHATSFCLYNALVGYILPPRPATRTSSSNRGRSSFGSPPSRNQSSAPTLASSRVRSIVPLVARSFHRLWLGTCHLHQPSQGDVAGDDGILGGRHGRQRHDGRAPTKRRPSPRGPVPCWHRFVFRSHDLHPLAAAHGG